MNKIEFIDASTNSIILEKRLVKNVKSNEILKSTFTDAVKLVALDTVNTTGVIGQSESGIFVASVDHQGVVVALRFFLMISAINLGKIAHFRMCPLLYFIILYRNSLMLLMIISVFIIINKRGSDGFRRL